MRLIFKNIKETPLNLMRRAGYGFWSAGKKSNKESFARRLSSGDYPRFHIYAKKEGNDLIINLHLDQKKPSYSGSHAHSGEYEDSEVLNQEAGRIKNILKDIRITPL